MRMRVLTSFAVFTAALLVAAGPRAQDSKEQARRNAVVARVGARVITAGELEDKLAQVPRYQLTEFGSNADEIKKKFLNDIVVRDALLAQGADDKHLADTLPTESRVARALSSATLRKMRADTGNPGTIPVEDVKAYYEANKARFDSPERILIHRILCKTKAEAAMVLDAFKKDPSPHNFTDLAREHSQDKATFMRGGNLGFLAADGTSNEAGLKADPSIVKAAAAVKDGELIQQPVAEGDMWAVVWRKGTVAPQHHTIEEVTPQIRDTLYKEHLEAARKKLVEDLRAQNVKDLNEPLLRTIDVSRADGAITPRKRPGQVPPLGAPLPEKKP
jgi:peptidyl-prolyl cis-trans isomerase C